MIRVEPCAAILYRTLLSVWHHLSKTPDPRSLPLTLAPFTIQEILPLDSKR